MAEHLKNVRADIRALTPPEDEKGELALAALPPAEMLGRDRNAMLAA